MVGSRLPYHLGMLSRIDLGVLVPLVHVALSVWAAALPFLWILKGTKKQKQLRQFTF